MSLVPALDPVLDFQSPPLSLSRSFPCFLVPLTATSRWTHCDAATIQKVLGKRLDSFPVF